MSSAVRAGSAASFPGLWDRELEIARREAAGWRLIGSQE